MRRAPVRRLGAVAAITLAVTSVLAVSLAAPAGAATESSSSALVSDFPYSYITINAHQEIRDDDWPFSSEWSQDDLPGFSQWVKRGTTFTYADNFHRCAGDEVRGVTNATVSLDGQANLHIIGSIAVYEGTSCSENYADQVTNFHYVIEPSGDTQVREDRATSSDDSYAKIRFMIVNTLPPAVGRGPGRLTIAEEVKHPQVMTRSIAAVEHRRPLPSEEVGLVISEP